MINVVIVGGGISGLATAYYLCERAKNSATPIHCTVLEGDARLGGKIMTEGVDGLVIEGGPESFATRKPWALALCRELGLHDRLLGADDTGRNYVLHHGQPARVPSSLQGFVSTPLLSLRGKLRAAQELIIPSRKDNDDESLGHLVRRRFGDEVVDNLVGPAVNSIYLSDVDQLSTQVSFDRFLKLEQQHGSLLKGMMAAQRAMQPNSAPAAPKPLPFATLPNGLSELIEALVDRLHAFGCDIRTDTRVSRIEKNVEAGYKLVLKDGQAFAADAVVLAVPTFDMAELIAPHDADAAERLRDVRYINVAVITFAYRLADMPTLFEGFGIAVPEREASPLLACEALSNKWPDRAPEDCVLMRAFVGGHRNEAIVARPDDILIDLAHRELARIFGLQSQPIFTRVIRWQPGNPQYPVGYLDRLARVETRLKTALPNVFLTGAGMRGLGIPDCVRQAEETATQMFDALVTKSNHMKQCADKEKVGA